MESLEIIGKLLICTFEVFMYYSFFKDIFEYKEENVKKHFILFIILIVALVFVNVLNNSQVNLITVPVLYFVLHFLLYQSTLKMRILYVTIFYMVSAGIEIGFALLYSIISDELLIQFMYSSYNSLFLMMFEKTITFLILRVIKALYKNVGYAIDYKLLRWAFVLPIASLMIFSGFLYSDLDMEILSISKIILVTGCFLLLFANVFVFYLFEKLSYTMFESSEFKLMNMKQKMEGSHYKILESVNQEHRQYLHDVQRYLKTIALLADKRQYEDILRIIKDMNVTIQNIDEKIYCNHSILNAILSERNSEAKKLGIIFEVFIEPNLNIGFVKDFDLIAIVGNLVDNAIEAASYCGNHKYININMFAAPDGNFIIMRIENNFVLKPKKLGEAFLTTKENQKNHGIGITNVRKLAEKYKGFLYLGANENIFTATLSLSAAKME